MSSPKVTVVNRFEHQAVTDTWPTLADLREMVRLTAHMPPESAIRAIDVAEDTERRGEFTMRFLLIRGFAEVSNEH
jgi:hypothetical protein